jgi:hypothetical protein
MTDDVSKSIIIPYGLNIGLNNTKFTIYNANENKNITIPKRTIIPSAFNTDWNTYLPTVPKTLCTYTSSSSITTYDNNAIFQYYSGGVQICLKNSLAQVFNINKKFSGGMLRSCGNNKGMITIGDETLQLYAKEKVSMYLSNTTYSTHFSFNNSSIQFVNTTKSNKYYKDKPISLPYRLNLSYKTTLISEPEQPTDVLKYYYKSLLITNTSSEFESEKEIIIPYGRRTSIGDNGIIFHKHGDEITDNPSPHQLEFPFGMKFDYDENNFIIKKSKNPTEGVKIPWETL